ncbi:MAG: YXWGXW repeat-containing protein [Sphingobacteriales bacterium]|nr:YXWGXW repeat-containing protein [Sphingobacteriales bacterium]
MKKKLFAFALFIVIGAAASQAQHVKVRIGFPVGISIHATGRAPFAGAVWVGPEWQWRGGNYVCVPGYWARPHRHGAVWVPGHWQYGRRGYKWVPGHWR